MKLYFNPSSLPRTMTRKEWRECDRWRRIVQGELRKETERQIETLRVYGTSIPEVIRRDMIDGLVNPPILLGTPL